MASSDQDMTKPIQLSQEDTAKVFAVHNAFKEMPPATNKKNILYCAKVRAAYRDTLVEMGRKYDYDPMKYFILPNGQLVHVEIYTPRLLNQMNPSISIPEP